MSSVARAAGARPAGGRGGAARTAEALAGRLPALLVAAERVAATVAQGVHGRRRVGQGESFWQFRPFVPGDALNRIDWRQSAKSDRSFIRETEWEAAQTVCLWRDRTASMRWRSRAAKVEKCERAELLLLALAALLLRGGERVRLITAASSNAAGITAGRTALDRLAQALARDQGEATLPPETALPRHARVVLFGDFLSPLPDIRSAIARLAAVPLSGHVVQVLDPAEALLPYSGRIRFEGVARDIETLIPRVEGVREEYARRLAAQQQGLAELCAAAGFGFSIHRTDQPPETALLALYTPRFLHDEAGDDEAGDDEAGGRVREMIFAAPWILLALPALPLLWWLLRVTPPAPRRETFPAVRLLLGLEATEETSARTPWWLLALRMLAAGLVIVGLARPVLDAGGRLPGSGPVLLVLDDGWAAAGDWARRVQAADAVLNRAEREGRRAALLATAAGEDGTAPRITPAMPTADLRARLAALRPKPWPADRAAAAAALAAWRPAGAAAVAGPAVVYIGDGIAEAGDAAFARALAAAGPVTEIGQAVAGSRLLLPPRAEADRLIARVAQVPRNAASPEAVVLAQSGDGRSLARVSIAIPPGAAGGEAAIVLPPELRNRLARLVLEGQASAGSVALLDERWRRRPVGLLAGDAAAANSPLLGELYYLRRALSPYTELRESDLATLLSRELSVLILADRVVADGEEYDRLADWVGKGGLLVRFAGPRTAEHPDRLLPVRLLEGDRQLGGALSWSQPAALAPFPPASPFAGLAVPEEVRVTRQVLAEPAADLSQHSWATLTDGTPLVTEATLGAGRIVLFHVTANADWSNLPLSGLFVDMLRRLVALSAGVANDETATVLAPAEILDGFGQFSPTPPAATGLVARAFATTPPSPRHPPGLYGPENGRRALNLGAALPPLRSAAPIPGARGETLGALPGERAVGPWLLALALALLAVDLMLSLALRGLLRPRLAGLALLLALAAAPAARAQDAADRYPALATRLAYVVTGDPQVDAVSRAGLAGLSEYVNRRTAATLAEPAAVTPGQDDLSFYPLLYWPVIAGAAPPAAAAAGSLNDYMGHGGIILLDTRDGGSGEGFAPGADAALRRIGRDLAIPPLAPLTTDHVLARAFYLLQEFPGRYTGDPVWVQRDQDRANDSVSPVVIGGNDWAAAWARDAQGRNPYAVIPGGVRQRTLAYRFGVNLVMYALTGNYKGDQVHVPAILERLGQ